MNLFSLEGKTIVVTGGTGVLGGAFVEAIAEAGGNVVVMGSNRSLEKGEQRAARIREAGGKAMALAADVLKEEELRRALDQIITRFGRIDGLVNGAGGNIPEGVVPPGADLFRMNVAGLRDAMELNLWGTIIPTMVFGEALASSGKASIVTISSMTAKRGLTRVLGYSMGKAAIDNFTRWFAIELANRYGDRIRINAIAPGFFITEQNRTLLTNPDGSYTSRSEAILRMTPFKKFGKPEDLKGALVYLLSDASEFVTGTVLDVDGGFTVNSGV
ncbi:MAG TPA: SDR family oxidoreductase [Chitinophagaceae bacterium]|nr:SDR family oxidoreductase [Chitinophagaceae bacterium]